MHSVSYFLVAAFHLEVNCSGSANSLYSPEANSEPGTITLSSEHLAVSTSALSDASLRMTCVYMYMYVYGRYLLLRVTWATVRGGAWAGR